MKGSTPGICAESPVLWTEYFKKKTDFEKPMAIQIAEATSHILQNKSIKIYPDKLIVGNYTPKRVGGMICPELHGLTALIEISTFNERAANALQPSRAFEMDPTYSMR